MSMPAYVMQELRNTVAVYCRELVMGNKDMKDSSQEDMMYACYHGDTTRMSHVEGLTKGEEPFTEMFYKLELETNREGNEERAQAKVNYMLELKGTFHLILDKRIIVYENGFTEKSLCEDGKSGKVQKVSARNIYDKARFSIANYRIALVFYKEYSGTLEPGVNPSGQSFDDMILYVRRKMFIALEGKTRKRTLTKKEKEAGKVFDKTEDDMPEKYLFQGYFAFCLWGPIPLSGRTLSCFAADHKSKVEKKSRKDAREEQAKQKAYERSVDEGADETFKRGVPLQEKKVAIQMAAAAHANEQKNARDLLAIANADHAATSKEFFQVLEAMKDAATPDERTMYQEWKQGLSAELTNIRKRKKKLQADCDRLMQMPKISTAMSDEYYGRVVVPAPGTLPSPLTVDTAVATGVGSASEKRTAVTLASQGSVPASATDTGSLRKHLLQDTVTVDSQPYSSQLACTSELRGHTRLENMSDAAFQEFAQQQSQNGGLEQYLQERQSSENNNLSQETDVNGFQQFLQQQQQRNVTQEEETKADEEDSDLDPFNDNDSTAAMIRKAEETIQQGKQKGDGTIHLDDDTDSDVDE
ncbi:unknown protein [Seminavis robusta]|uniref:Uncharacterized protein n=1 Tax=Seminavis robusta TaxID=568900 RepID=A0A9N8ECF0_9STRA|nr:unknown protein [Seminavis robusta]|eukprot:Sro885_g216140.1 n/a (585) ;mRNA; r:34608-36362